MVAEKTTKKMPKGVGKRIIETLKTKGTDAEYNEDIKYENEVEERIESAPEIEEVENITEEYYVEKQEEIEAEPAYKYEEPSTISYTCTPKAQKNTNMSANMSDIDTLLSLISQLPSGVTKQTGALIIRQTMEAMGISMNNVLSNAQSVQEGLEYSIRNNVNVIEEYRTKIKLLEQEIQRFRKKSHELEDVISLFILSDDKKSH
ncbi:MAG: hypothetical protein A2Y25_00975 [Candidatus Melainabacteria bacterium GWF2_37_15]|nr:MAG: hypothetical protein A2Y25_00975 [Candidatus Melainabacteria bacterium GWF2_37_15]